MTIRVNVTGSEYWNNGSAMNKELLLAEINAQEVKLLFPVIFFYAFILTVGVFGNFLVLLVYSFRYKRSPARIYILFLAAIDFSLCLFGLPYHLIDLTHPYTFTNSAACKSLTFIVTTLFHMSIFGLIVISVDRYLKICRPLGKLQISYFGRRRACVAAVIAAILLSWPNIVLYGPSEMESQIYNITGYACFIETPYFETNYPFIYIMSTLVVCVGSTVFLILAYSLICRQIYIRYKDNMIQVQRCAYAADGASMTDEVSLKSYTLPGNEKHLTTTALQETFKKDQSSTEKKEETNSRINIYINPHEEDDVEVGSEKVQKYTQIDNNEKEGQQVSNMSVTRQRSFSLDSFARPEDIYVHLNNNGHRTETKDEAMKAVARLGNAQVARISDSSLSTKSSKSSSTRELCSSENNDKGFEESTTSRRTSNRLELPRFGGVFSRQEAIKRRYSEQYGNKFGVNRRNQRSTSAVLGLMNVTSNTDGLRIHTCNNSSNSLAISSQGTLKSAKSVPRKHSKITKIMLTITTVFVISYAPALIITIYSFVRPELWDIMSVEETAVCEFFLRFYLVNNICNPFIYGFWDKRFKREISITFKKIFPFRSSCEKCYERVSLHRFGKANV